MSIGADERFAFDVQGYLHLRRALPRDELLEIWSWIEEVEHCDVQALNLDRPELMQHQLNRPVSRVVDADPRFARLLDHPAVAPYLVEFLGPDYKHIDNDLYDTYPGYAGGSWHRGVQAHPSGHWLDGQFACTMVKVFYCMTPVRPGQGEFVVVPGSHRTEIAIDLDRVDLPAQHIFDDVDAGDVILFNEALLHNGRPNRTLRTRRTVIMNFGRADAGPWLGYAPSNGTLATVTDRQQAILTGGAPVWVEPAVV